MGPSLWREWNCSGVEHQVKNPDWTRDEIIIVAAAVAKQDWKQLDKGSAESVRISELLQAFWSGSNLEMSDTL